MAIKMTPSPAATSTTSRHMEPGPYKSSAAQKWHNPLGPPPGSNFGARLLKEDEDVYTQNAWFVTRLETEPALRSCLTSKTRRILIKTFRDHVELPDDYHDRAAEIIAIQHAAPVHPALRGLILCSSFGTQLKSKQTSITVDQRITGMNSILAIKQRKVFFDPHDFESDNHGVSFFKDRAWLRLEFPELIACSEADVSGALPVVPIREVRIEGRSALTTCRLGRRSYLKWDV